MQDTIAAIATAQGGPIGIVRVSGEGALAMVSQIFRPKNGKTFAETPVSMLTYGTLFDRTGAVLDRPMAVHFRAPHSYTGEDVVELHCHGSPAVLAETLATLFAQGARPAEAGEFTKRAFLNGKLDLSGAEAVQKLISAQTMAQARNALCQIEGRVGNTIRQIRDELLGLVAHFHAVVDYPDEEIDPFLFEQATQLLHQSTTELFALAESFERGRVMTEGVPCVILGKPNVGKSSLLNALAKSERAIVTDIAGTTRDVLSEVIPLGSLQLRLLDTAGIRETDDVVEAIGIERALQQAKEATLILAVFDGTQALSSEDEMVLASSQKSRTIALINKTDLPQSFDLEQIRPHFAHILPISAKTGEGIDALYPLIEQLVGLEGAVYDGSFITSARQAAAICRAAERCEAALFAAQCGMTPDAVVMDTEGAIAALGEVTGQSVSQDVVAKIFANFCVGK